MSPTASRVGVHGCEEQVHSKRPRRTQSLRSEGGMFSSLRDSVLRKRKKREEAKVEKEHGEEGEEKEEKEEVLLPYRPVKAKFVQVHVTSDDIDVPPSTPTPPTTRPTTEPTTATCRIDEFRRPAIPLRTTSLHRQRKTKTWPTSSTEQQHREGGGGGPKHTFDTTPTLVRTPWEVERGRPGSRWSRTGDRTSNLPRKVWAQLPREIYQCILDHVEGNHYTTTEGARGGGGGLLLDVRGVRTDLRSLCLVSRQWHRVAKEHLYRDIWLPSNKVTGKRKFLGQPRKSRLKLLLASLKGDVGDLVKELRVGREVADEILAEANGGPSLRKESTVQILVDVVRSCHNLERFSGSVPPATATTFPLFEALAATRGLKQHIWHLDSARILSNLGDFIFCHGLWVNLESLVVVADPQVDLGQVAIAAVLHKLPMLKHFMLSGIHRSDFHDGSLFCLPALKSLRLEKLEGLTDQGVEQLAFSRLAGSVESLSLVDLELVSLQTVQTILSHLTRLRTFKLVQNVSPEPPVERMQPLCSNSLTYLHWDCTTPGSAISCLSHAITHGRFPRLRKIKIPCDYKGKIQSICRPIPRVKLTAEDVAYFDQYATSETAARRDLRIAQIRAQIRISESRRQPSFNVVVQDESMEIRLEQFIGSYLGDMASRVEYCVEPDVDVAALAEFEEVAWPRRDGGARLEGCVELGRLFS